ncbi:MATE family efflux transporter [Cetobacterium sp. SF1]|uniref:MATE family efflux transporter n=1 Tax=Cetobacterium sp. SF1 TaxID=3417654 RepID=UPI003CF136EB
MNKDNFLFENLSIKKLFFKFAIPSTLGMLIVALQIMIDGIFIANVVGPNGLGAINISMSLLTFSTGIAIMISSGGAVLTGMYLGDKKYKKAREVQSFTFLIYVIINIIFSLGIIIFFKEVLWFLGVTPSMVDYVKTYLSIMVAFNLFYNAPILTETFLRVNGKPNLVFFSGLIALTINIFLDYIFVVRLNLGMKGAAMATVIAAGTAALVFLPQLKFTRPRGNLQLLKTILFNGSSEMFSVLSSAVTIYVFNRAVLKYIGELGVSALTIVFYIDSLVNISLYGLTMALQPIVSYNLGAKKIKNIYSVLKISLITSGILGGIFFIFMKFYSTPLIKVFTKENLALTNLAKEVIFYYTFTYIFSFINIISGAFHTAIGKPVESVVISLSKSILFVMVPLAILPIFLGNKGIWLATPTGEALCAILSIYLLMKSIDSLDAIK